MINRGYYIVFPVKKRLERIYQPLFPPDYLKFFYHILHIDIRHKIPSFMSPFPGNGRSRTAKTGKPQRRGPAPPARWRTVKTGGTDNLLSPRTAGPGKN